jgi:hypothetical protein
MLRRTGSPEARVERRTYPGGRRFESGKLHEEGHGSRTTRSGSSCRAMPSVDLAHSVAGVQSGDLVSLGKRGDVEHRVDEVVDR